MKPLNYRYTVIAVVLAGLSTLSGCATADTTSARKTGRENQGVTSAELQHSVERFVDRLASQITSAYQPLLVSEDPKIRVKGLRHGLAYYRNAVEIATGPVPELNALDMIVFVALSRQVFEEYWIPEVFGEAGKPLLEALKKSETDAWKLGRDQFLRPDDITELRGLIAQWKKDNPDQVEVATVRLSELDFVAGTVEGQSSPSGVFGIAKRAANAAEQALLVGERALFLSQRAPDLLRLQARLAMQEIVGDGMMHLSALSAPENLPADLSAAVSEVSDLTRNAEGLVREIHKLLNDIGPLISAAPGKDSADLTKALDAATRLSATTIELLREVKQVAPNAGEGEQQWDVVRDRLETSVKRLLLYVGLLVAALIGLFWAGYFVVRRR